MRLSQQGAKVWIVKPCALVFCVCTSARAALAHVRARMPLRVRAHVLSVLAGIIRTLKCPGTQQPITISPLNPAASASLGFVLESGNTVSPPSSTLLRYLEGARQQGRMGCWVKDCKCTADELVDGCWIGWHVDRLKAQAAAP